jgi:hypothetical protein
MDTDPNDDPSQIIDTNSMIRLATSHAGSQQWNFNSPKTMEFARRGDDQMYYTGLERENKRFSQQGTGYLLQVTDPLDFNGAALATAIDAGSLYIDWTCEFETPQIEPEVAQPRIMSPAPVVLNVLTSSLMTPNTVPIGGFIPDATYVLTMRIRLPTTGTVGGFANTDLIVRSGVYENSNNELRIEQATQYGIGQTSSNPQIIVLSVADKNGQITIQNTSNIISTDWAVMEILGYRIW